MTAVAVVVFITGQIVGASVAVRLLNRYRAARAAAEFFQQQHYAAYAAGYTGGQPFEQPPAAQPYVEQPTQSGWDQPRGIGQPQAGGYPATGYTGPS